MHAFTTPIVSFANNIEENNKIPQPKLTKTFIKNNNLNLPNNNKQLPLPIHLTAPSTAKYQVCLQTDSGANCSVTNDSTLLVNFTPIASYPIMGISDESPAIYCTGKGLLI